MLNLGLIGDIKLLDPYIKKVQKGSDIHITGKSSMGTRVSPEDYRLSVPEFNRIELIERSDALIVNHFALFPFDLICKTIKKTKHIFAAEYPDFSVEEYEELAKLINEAQTVFQITNKLFNLPAVRWMKDNFRAPGFWDISLFKTDSQNDDLLKQLLLMLNALTGNSPKRIDAVSFKAGPSQSEFNNLRLDYGNATIINISYGKHYSDEFIIKSYSPGNSVYLNILSGKFLHNNNTLRLTSYKLTDELDSFLNNIISGRNPVTGIGSYLSVIRTYNQIKSKLSQFTSI